MKNIVLARIDDRLLHGQVIVTWLSQTKANKILIADDEVANDEINKRILKATCPEGVKIAFYDVAKSEEYLKGENRPGDRLIVLSKTPFAFEKLIENGVGIEHVILGGMGAKKGREGFIRNCSASQEEKDSMKHIIDMGVPVTFQLVPTEKSIEVAPYLK